MKIILKEAWCVYVYYTQQVNDWV